MVSHLDRQFGFSSSVTGWDVIHGDYNFFCHFIAKLPVNSGQLWKLWKLVSSLTIEFVKMVFKRIECTRMCARKSFVFSFSIAGVSKVQ